MNTVELGSYGGLATRAFKLHGQELKRGDAVTAEMLNGLAARQRRALEGAGYVKYFNNGKDGPTETVEIKKPTDKKTSGRTKRKGGK